MISNKIYTLAFYLNIADLLFISWEGNFEPRYKTLHLGTKLVINQNSVFWQSILGYPLQNPLMSLMMASRWIMTCLYQIL
jgi:hypothetical protein